MIKSDQVVDKYPKTYVRAFYELEDVLDTMKRVDVQNAIEGRDFSFTYTMEVGPSNEYYLVVIVWKEDAENN